MGQPWVTLKTLNIKVPIIVKSTVCDNSRL